MWKVGHNQQQLGSLFTRINLLLIKNVSKYHLQAANITSCPMFMTYRVSQIIFCRHLTSKGALYRNLFHAGISYASSNKPQYVNEEWFTIDKLLRRDRWPERGGKYYKLFLFYDTVSTEDNIKHRISYGKLKMRVFCCVAVSLESRYGRFGVA
jgi:hypothetical protein